MSIAQIAFGDYDHELKQTRKLLEAIPNDQLDWQPHPKAWRLGKLAEHVAQLPWLFAQVAREPELDFATVPKPQPATSMEQILKLFDGAAAEARAALKDVQDETLDQPWTFRVGDHVIFTAPRGPTMRSFGISHMIHHRAQLTIYLRQLDAKVPGLYGPSADEQ